MKIKNMIFEKENKKVVFDDSVEAEDINNHEFNWVYLCESCRQKYKDIIDDSQIDTGVPEESICSVFGCYNYADYYADFRPDEVSFEEYEIDTNAWEEYYSYEEREKKPYCPSATAGDYSPASPWNAPGMSIRDFI